MWVRHSSPPEFEGIGDETSIQLVITDPVYREIAVRKIMGAAGGGGAVAWSLDDWVGKNAREAARGATSTYGKVRRSCTNSTAKR